MKKINILWIPGLGADKRMFYPIISELNKLDSIYNHHFLEYLETNHDISSLEEYTLRILSVHYAQLFKKKFDLVIACSMGGMIAQILLEKKKLKFKKLILLSTAFSGNDLTNLSKLLIFLLNIVPLFFRRTIQNIISLSYRIFRFYIKENKDFSKMFYHYPTQLFFQSLKWIYHWKGIQNHILDQKNIIIIHGEKDPLISFKKMKKKKKITHVFKGNHILFVLYPKEIANIITRVIQY